MRKHGEDGAAHSDTPRRSRRWPHSLRSRFDPQPHRDPSQAIQMQAVAKAAQDWGGLKAHVDKKKRCMQEEWARSPWRWPIVAHPM